MGAAHRELEDLRKRVRERLRAEPLAAALGLAPGWRDAGAEELRLVGLVPEAFELFDDPADPSSFRPRPPAAGLSLTPEDPATALAAVRMQVPAPAKGVALGLKLLRDLARSLDPETAVVLVVKPGVRADSLLGLWRGWGLDPARLRLVEHETSTIFAQDNGKGARVDDEPALLLPLRAGGAAARDALPEDGGAFGVPVHTSRLQWDGGNLLHDGHATLVGANTVALNELAGGLTTDQVLAQIAAETGGEPLVLGDLDEARAALIEAQDAKDPANAREGGQADFHIDLDVCPLGVDAAGRPRVAIADPPAGAAHAPAIERDSRRFEGHFVGPAEARRIFRRNLDATLELRAPRLELYRRQLGARGYALVPVPDVRLVRRLDYLNRVNFTFNHVNVLPGSHWGRPAVRAFAYGVAELDAAAADAYRDAGVDTVTLGDPVTADEVFALDGGPHCVVSRLA
ncbi:MAG TPA: hypothetical protein VMV46_00260 [Thermoanaerobaculia bacterium]|nr:hypothetical protein [Thermoanaerobaculia bacterium]